MPSYTPLLGAPQAGNLDFQGFEARRIRLHDLGANSMAHASNWNGTPKDGAIGYSSDAGDKRPYFYDTATGTDIPWLRGAYQETIAAQWNFTIATGTSPFAVTSTTVVANLNADRTDGYHASETATASTLAARDSNGRLTAADPSGSANGELVTYGFMFSFMAGVRDPKAAVLAIYPTVLPAFTFSSGGNTITADANGAINPVDGQTLAVNDRIGIVFETGANKPYNGIFIVTQVGSAGTPFILQRAVDANQDAEVTNGMQFWVTSGTTYGSSGWLLTTPDPITLNTTDLNFVQNNGATGITAGNGIVKAGNTIHAIQSSAYTQWGVVYAPTTATLALTAAGTAGYYFAGAGGSAPVWTAPAALTKTDDTNVTLTLGGSPSVALLAAASLTLGWTGQLSVARGGTGAATLTGIVKGNGTSAMTAVLPGTTSGVTSGTIPKFNSSSPYLDDSIITQSGTTITVTGSLTTTGTTTLATSLTGMLKGTSGVVSAVTGATNRVTFWSDANTISSDANLTWNGTTLVVTGGLSVTSTSAFGGDMSITRNSTNAVLDVLVTNTNAGNGARSRSLLTNGTATAGMQLFGTGHSTSGAQLANRLQIDNDGAGGIAITTSNAAGTISFWGGSTVLGWTITAANVLRAAGAQTIDNTAGILTLTGTGGLTLSTAANTNILLSPNGTGQVGIGATPDNQLTIRKDTAASVLGVYSGSTAGTRIYIRNDDATNAGDSWIYFGVNAQDWTMGIDNSDSDSFNIERGTGVLGTGTNVMKLTVAGVMTVANATISAMTAKSILFSGASGAVSQDNANFQYDASQLSIGTLINSDDRALKVARSGAKTISEYGVSIITSQTSSTASINKYALFIESSGTWNGASANHYGIFISAVSGGTTNWALYNNTAANVYLGTGNTVQLGGSSSGIVSLATAAAAGTWTLTLPTSGGTNNYFLSTNGSGVSAWTQPTAAMIGSGAALTRTDDTNITLTLGGSPTTALLAATSLTLGWTGTLAASRGGTGRAVFTYTTTFGDASLSSFTITHNLGSKDVCVTIYETASPYTEWYSFVVKKATTNTITIDCGFIPGSGEFTVGIK